MDTPANDDKPTSDYKHYYNFAFILSDGREFSHIAVQICMDEMKITKDVIDNAKFYAAPGVQKHDMVLLGVSYLGFMSREEFCHG